MSWNYDYRDCKYYYNGGCSDNTYGNCISADGKYCNCFTPDRSVSYKYDEDNNKSSGGCFITTATVEHMGKDDDCEELTLLRKYRNYLAVKDSSFYDIVKEYYEIAPQVVSKIQESKNKDEILDNIYNDMVLPVTEMLKIGKIEEAKNHYLNEYNKLKDKFLNEPQKKLAMKLN